MNCVYSGEYRRVVDHIFSREGAPQTHQSVIKISRNTAVCQSSIGRIIHDNFTASLPPKKTVPIWLLMYFQVV